MGVTGLWQILHPCARPIKLETLNRKRLAVDASIWIYQFLKAVRDKEGNALRNSHVVGFFRRICKLLYFGIKPVFVFDGGAPALKRQTISGRKKRREGRREDAVRTAGKLLAVQMQRLAEEEEDKRKREAEAARAPAREEEEVPDNLVYVDELQMSAQERQQNRKFKKKDQYHLPDLDVPLSEMGAPNDPRVMSLEELEHYARQFDAGEEINVYDFSKIDFDSPFFTSLPASDRYNILNAARLRSRLRMGYSKEQLDTMFPDRMAFSRFQIERVRERNELTQRLMNINGMNDDTMFGAGRIAGEKGREYVLVKNDGVEGGWALGVVTKDEGKEDKPIDVDKLPGSSPVRGEEDEFDDDDDFEDVPIEGLNRLPRRPQPIAERNSEVDQIAARRKAVYASRKRRPKKKAAADSLFVAADEPADEEEEDWENVDMAEQDDLFEEKADGASADEDEDLNRAIAMSLQQPQSEGEEMDDFQEVLQQAKAEETAPFKRGTGLSIARLANARSAKAATNPFGTEDSDDDDMDLQAALAESRKSKHVQRQPVRQPAYERRAEPPKQKTPVPTTTASSVTKKPLFSGPLPFEKLDLGSSLLGKKKMEQLQEANAGGFQKDDGRKEKKKAPTPPPWFSGDVVKDLAASRAEQVEEQKRTRQELEERRKYQLEEVPEIMRQETPEVIDLEAEDDRKGEVINLESDDETMDGTKTIPQAAVGEQPSPIIVDPELRMGDLADAVRAAPPVPSPKPEQSQPPPASEADEEPYEWDPSDNEAPAPASKDEREQIAQHPAGGSMQPSRSPSPDLEFEDIDMPDKPPTPAKPPTPPEPQILQAVSPNIPPPASGVAEEGELMDAEFDAFSDPDDEELLTALAMEAEEHARFASTLNNRSQRQNIEDYERELKQLRSQQKRDRRDADEVTHIMITECQQLLKLFGLPYITAPMEAEAQCAALVDMGLVDGIVTDDSDIFLFGGNRVYKNMFNQAKFVECYLSNDLEKEFNLDRQKLIAIAHLLGSDYTEGLPGVGPVTALEIISEFGTLEAFREWWMGVQNGTIPKSEDASHPFRKKFRKNATKIFLPPVFPDTRVNVAYLEPDVDRDPSEFQWGVPDLDSLRSFLMATIGWSQERTDEVLVPVIRDMNKRESEGTQSNITKFFSGAGGAGAFAPRVVEKRSKRMDNALGKLATHAKRKAQLSLEEATERDGHEGNGNSTRGNSLNDVDGNNDDLELSDADSHEPPRKARKPSAKASTKRRVKKRG